MTEWNQYTEGEIADIRLQILDEGYEHGDRSRAVECPACREDAEVLFAGDTGRRQGGFRVTCYNCQTRGSGNVRAPVDSD